MNVNELLEKYRALLAENHSLREENEILKARLGFNLLSFGRAEESIIRLVNPSIADELLGSIQK
ncbi:MAG: hypothetical protein Q8M86_12675 [Syntrophales bacterium]|nr:hypothetical protein [Syntrophales bacterium]MDP3098793.1 hypothetical protein [Syntrophales bacterium]